MLRKVSSNLRVYASDEGLVHLTLTLFQVCDASAAAAAAADVPVGEGGRGRRGGKGSGCVVCVMVCSGV